MSEKRRIVKRCLICKRPIWFSKRRICKNSKCGELAIRTFLLKNKPDYMLDLLLYGNTIIKIDGGDNEHKKPR